MQPSRQTTTTRAGRMWIGRQYELSLLETWLASPQSESMLFSVTGMGGMGKSALLEEMIAMTRRCGVHALWVDGRASANTPAGFLDDVEAAVHLDIDTQPGASSWRSFAARIGPDCRLVLFIDNFEALSPIEGWLMHSFLPRLPQQGVLLVLAKRQPLSITWKTNPAWRHRIRELTLKPLSRSETKSYLEQFCPDGPELVLELCQTTQGYPLAVGVAASILEQRGKMASFPGWQTHDSSTDSLPIQIAQVISANLFRDPIPQHLHEAIDVMTVVTEASHELLNQIIDTPLTPVEYHRLAALSFIQPTSNGLRLHDVVRLHLLRDFRTREPDRFAKFHTKVTATLYQRIASASPSEAHLSARILDVYLDDLSVKTPYGDLTVSDDSFHIDFCQPTDLPMLLEMLEFWRSYSVTPSRGQHYPQFLAELCEFFPQCVRVIRGDEGTPIAMFIMMLVYKKTSPILHRYFPEEMDECFTPEEMACEDDVADNYFAVWVAYLPDTGHYSGPELVGALCRDSMRMLGRDTRVSLVATNPHLKALLTMLGFEKRPTVTRVCDTDTEEAEVLTLDLRGERFVEWIRQMILAGYSSQSDQPLLPLLENNLDHHLGSTRDLTDIMVRDALAKLWDLPKLGRSEVATILGLSGQELQAWLLHLLEDDDRLSTPQRKRRHVLYVVFVKHSGNLVTASKELFMSRATAYRRVAGGITELREWIAYREPPQSARLRGANP